MTRQHHQIDLFTFDPCKHRCQ